MMTKRIFRSICLVAIAVFLASVVLIMGVLYSYFSNASHAQLKMQTQLAARGVTGSGMAYFDNFKVSGARITWIDADGTVLYDSAADTATMENHLQRAEVQDALANGYGESTRYSSTLLERSYYSAQALPDGTVLRLSVSQHSIVTLLLGMMQPICIVFVIALVLSVGLAVRVSRKIVAPLNEIDLENPLSNEGYDELSPFLRRIDSQQRQLRSQKAELLQKENELNTIIGSMNEGMLLLNQKGKIVSINPAAARLLETGTDCVGADMLSLSRNLALQELLACAMSGEAGMRTLTLRGERYQADASPITSDGVTEGAALFFFNVTEKEHAEQLRREFTANVSHELKTPLHAILGRAELLKNDMVREEDWIPFAGKIYDEAQRMVRLIEDIIHLSELDEGAKDMVREDVDLYGLAEKAIQSLAAAADDAQVSFSLSGGSTTLNGVSPLLYSIVYNLCDNAVKYNRSGGEVAVRVEKDGGDIVLQVRDTGIGIAPEHQERIFERFYRVDKSRSREVGGTGLGLSIVKHAAKIHHAAVALESAPGKGTTVVVRFPAESGA